MCPWVLGLFSYCRPSNFGAHTGSTEGAFDVRVAFLRMSNYHITVLITWAVIVIVHSHSFNIISGNVSANFRFLAVG